MGQLIVIVIAAVVITILAVVLKPFLDGPGAKGRKGGDDRAVDGAPPFRKIDWLLSKAERSFFGVLEQAAGSNCRVMAKVRLADLVWTPRDAVNGSARQSWVNKVDRKHVDFVVCTRDELRPLLVVELDDSSHASEKAQKRDRVKDDVLEAAGLPLVRVPARSGYVVGEVRERLKGSLGGNGFRIAQQQQV